MRISGNKLFLVIILMLSVNLGWTQSENCLTDKEIDSLLSKLYRGRYFEEQSRLLSKEIEISNDVIFELQKRDSLHTLMLVKVKSKHKKELKFRGERNKKNTLLIGLSLFTLGLIVGIMQ